MKKKLLVKAIVVNGVIWSTETQCDIFVHPKHAGKCYSRIAIGLFLKELSEVSIGVSLCNLPSLKAIAHMLENEHITATDNIHRTFEINHTDLLMIIRVVERKKTDPRGIDTIIDEIMSGEMPKKK